MPRKATRLRNLKLSKVDRVDAGANEGAFIVLAKAAPAAVCPECGAKMSGPMKAGQKCPQCGHTMTASDTAGAMKGRAAKSDGNHAEGHHPEGGIRMTEAEQLAELRKAIDQAVAEATAPLTEKIGTLEADLAKAQEPKGEPEAKTEEIDKSALPEAVRKRLDELEEANRRHEAAIAKAADDRLTAHWTDVAKGLDQVAVAKSTGGDAVAELAGHLKTLSKASDAPEATSALDALVGMLQAAQARAESGALFSELGGGGESMGSAEAELNGMAKAYRTEHPELTEAQAFRDVAKANPALVAKMDKEALRA